MYLNSNGNINTQSMSFIKQAQNIQSVKDFLILKPENSNPRSLNQNRPNLKDQKMY